MKKLILKVSTNNDFYDNSADYAVIELDDSVIAEIKKLAQAVRELNIYKAVKFDYSPKMRVVDWEIEAMEDGLEALADFDGRTECDCLNVTDTSFFWSGFYKHTNVRWETSLVEIAELETAEAYDERERLAVAA